MPQAQWQIAPKFAVPQWFVDAVGEYTPESEGIYAAQLLWQRGIRDLSQLAGFLDPDSYQPTNPFAFGQEMKWAVQHLLKARAAGEKVVIWGDFDADGITATSVLWEGLGQFLPQGEQLSYYIPNRLTESHGLNCEGIEKLAVQGVKLIVTCDTGSTNIREIEYAQQLGIDIIVTDHHSLPEERPPVVSIINPRYFAETHPLYHLSGVAVAYKLVEAIYQSLPGIVQQPLENLLDLVAIGLIADLVQLSGDCRYLAQKGIQQLQKQDKPETAIRPGVAHLLKLCKTSGDRPTDISFGLGPRINAVSRLHGDASFCVELLTSRDPQRCQQLALETELANTRRKSLQKDVTEQVKKKLAQLDLSTTSVIVLDDPQWQSGVLGLVAGQIAQEYGRPTILLTTAIEGEKKDKEISKPEIARGSARSVHKIDLYQLLTSQAHLLHRFGGHPFAAGLSLARANIPIFRDAINQQLRQQIVNISSMMPVIEADLTVTVAELGKKIFRELKLVEPCGMGNPVPKLLIKNCWFTNVWNKNIEDLRGNKVQYIKTTFLLYDDSVNSGFPGLWWGHYKEELPQNQTCDAIVELDWNPSEKRYEVRLVAVSPSNLDTHLSSNIAQDLILDYRSENHHLNKLSHFQPSDFILLQECPISWHQIQQKYQRAIASNRKLALAYSLPSQLSSQQVWQQLVGIAKYLSRTGQTVSQEKLQQKLELSEFTLQLGLDVLKDFGFQYQKTNDNLKITWSGFADEARENNLEIFLDTVEEEKFQREYFYKIALNIINYQLSVS